MPERPSLRQTQQVKRTPIFHRDSRPSRPVHADQGICRPLALSPRDDLLPSPDPATNQPVQPCARAPPPCSHGNLALLRSNSWKRLLLSPPHSTYPEVRQVSFFLPAMASKKFPFPPKPQALGSPRQPAVGYPSPLRSHASSSVYPLGGGLQRWAYVHFSTVTHVFIGVDWQPLKSAQNPASPRPLQAHPTSATHSSHRALGPQRYQERHCSQPPDFRHPAALLPPQPSLLRSVPQFGLTLRALESVGWSTWSPSPTLCGCSRLPSPRVYPAVQPDADTPSSPVLSPHILLAEPQACLSQAPPSE